jgi:uncharacterized protein
MTSEEIHELLKAGKFSHNCTDPQLIETHISWVVLCDRHVFKMKKPIHYSFLDFSTLEKRKYYCEQEVVLNRRLASDIYLDVVPVMRSNGQLIVSKKAKGIVIDYAVLMKRLEGHKQMDVMLTNGQVHEKHLEKIADALITFHKKCEIIYEKDSYYVQHNFNDILDQRGYLLKELGKYAADFIDHALKKTKAFIKDYSRAINRRTELGFVRDCHGDLHSRNIFLYDDPIIFDCIEFNPEIRQIDILNELAFFCMDLEAFGHKNLSDCFIVYYNNLFQVIRNAEDEKLFLYFKAYRANVRAKVNALRAKSAVEKDKERILAECDKYLRLMHSYIENLG